MSEQPAIDVNALWKYVTDQVKTKVTMPSLWRAMEAAVPLLIENDELILGFRLASGHQSGLITDNRYRNVIEQTLESATRRRIRIRLIGGETLNDWEMEKAAAAEAQRMAQRTRQQVQATATAGASWESVGDQIVRKYSATPHRSLPSIQGRFLEEALALLVEAYPRLMPETPAEADERNYCRALDRVAERTGIPASLVANMVYLRLKK